MAAGQSVEGVTGPRHWRGATTEPGASVHSFPSRPHLRGGSGQPGPPSRQPPASHRSPAGTMSPVCWLRWPPNVPLVPSRAPQAQATRWHPSGRAGRSPAHPGPPHSHAPFLRVFRSPAGSRRCRHSRKRKRRAPPAAAGARRPGLSPAAPSTAGGHPRGALPFTLKFVRQHPASPRRDLWGVGTTSQEEFPTRGQIR
ncbi:translation initiation factor IF-2-like [Pteropus medius]|uniref:translation initiation factor IF-2-like n=1 Tax=Pteropus vampyrus TaxID=132908 RepID=UPI00196A39F2|nr:translation initiation factor IF-2-like [Pteropus giganteus]